MKIVIALSTLALSFSALAQLSMGIDYSTGQVTPVVDIGNGMGISTSSGNLSYNLNQSSNDDYWERRRREDDEDRSRTVVNNNYYNNSQPAPQTQTNPAVTQVQQKTQSLEEQQAKIIAQYKREIAFEQKLSVVKSHIDLAVEYNKLTVEQWDLYNTKRAEFDQLDDSFFSNLEAALVYSTKGIESQKLALENLKLLKGYGRNTLIAESQKNAEANLKTLEFNKDMVNKTYIEELYNALDRESSYYFAPRKEAKTLARVNKVVRICSTLEKNNAALSSHMQETCEIFKQKQAIKSDLKTRNALVEELNISIGKFNELTIQEKEAVIQKMENFLNTYEEESEALEQIIRITNNQKQIYQDEIARISSKQNILESRINNRSMFTSKKSLRAEVQAVGNSLESFCKEYTDPFFSKEMEELRLRNAQLLQSLN